MKQNVFQQLLDCIKDNRPGILQTRYRDSGIERRLITQENPEEWAKLMEREQETECIVQNNGFELTEYYEPQPRLIVLGGGHIAVPLTEFGAGLGFRVTVYDDRPAFANKELFPKAEHVVCDAFDVMDERLEITDRDMVVIVTRGHRHDTLCLEQILEGEQPYYLGMIGSTRRVAMVKSMLEMEEGYREKLENLHAPIGLPIGGVTPEEIAISILAEIIKHRRVDRPAKGKSATKGELGWLALAALPAGAPAALVTVVETKGSTPRERGAKMLVYYHGKTVGSIGGGCAEAEAVKRCRQVIHRGGYALMEIDLTDSAEEDGMVCGGKMQVMLEAL